MTKIIVGVDESEGAEVALRWAQRAGELRGWPVTAVLAWDFLNQHGTAPDQPFDPDYDEASAKAALDAIVERILGAETAAGVERRTVLDLPAPALIGTAEPDDLLVVGARGLGGFRGLLLGSVSQHVLHHAPCPVAVVRPTAAPAEGGSERVVVGFDGSATAGRALRWALEEGAARSGTVEVVHAWQLPYLGGEPMTGAFLNPDELQGEAAKLLDEAVDAGARDVPGVTVKRTVVCGDAASAILDVADGAALVVVGSRGIGGFGGLLLGSVSQKLARHAPCPVVVVPSAG
jgi:nucleotide-binding universal stress UspA family protein